MSTGPLGYGDFLSQSSWDNGGDDYVLFGAQTGNVVSSILNCSNFGYVYIHAGISLGSVLVTCDWFADMAGTKNRGSRSFIIDAGTSGAFQLIFPNLGPFFRITHAPATGGTNWTANTECSFTNRVHSQLAIGASFFTAQFAPALAAAGNILEQWNNYAPGPNGITTFGGTQGISVNLEYMAANFTWSQVDSWAVATGAWDYRIRVLPLTPMRFNVTNSSGTTANNTSLQKSVQSLTGSS